MSSDFTFLNWLTAEPQKTKIINVFIDLFKNGIFGVGDTTIGTYSDIEGPLYIHRVPQFPDSSFAIELKNHFNPKMSDYRPRWIRVPPSVNKKPFNPEDFSEFEFTIDQTRRPVSYSSWYIKNADGIWFPAARHTWPLAENPLSSNHPRVVNINKGGSGGRRRTRRNRKSRAKSHKRR